MEGHILFRKTCFFNMSLDEFKLKRISYIAIQKKKKKISDFVSEVSWRSESSLDADDNIL